MLATQSFQVESKSSYLLCPISNNFGWPFRLTVTDSTLRTSSTACRSSCNRRVNRLYSVGELCAEHDDADAVESVLPLAWNFSSNGLWLGVGAGGGLRILELKRVCIARSVDEDRCQMAGLVAFPPSVR